MRAGYAGRGLVYLVIAGFSLWAIWRGGDAEGTGGALKSLDNSGWGMAVLWLIAIGLFAYMIWRVVDAIWDLEAYGSDGKAMVARAGMVVTGLIHGAIGVAAVSLIFGSGGTGGESKIAHYTSEALSLPFGRWLVGIAGLVTMGAGIYYLHKGWAETYREKLKGSGFTESVNWAMKAGLIAQGVIVGLVGFFLARAGYLGQPEEAGGLKQVFEFLGSQAFGQAIVVAVCLGLLGFALFCFINARYRIVPRAADDGVETLAARLG
jgi:hypothetical protein